MGGLTIRSNVFKMPVGGHDSKVCGSGVEIVNKQTSKDCCLDPSSSYLGYTAYQPYSKAKYEQKAYRRYWCGEHLGPEEQISGGGSIIKVFTGENYKCTYDPVGFEIEYKVDIGH